MAPRRNRRAFETRAIHAGQAPDPATGAVVPPVYTATTFAQDGIGENKGYVYSRMGNPTRLTVEACLADLEGAAAAFAFPTGLAAAATMLELLDAGARIIAHDDLYGGIYRLLALVRERSGGHRITFVDFSDLPALRAAVADGADLLWFETPSNPLLKIVDIAAVADIARGVRALSVCDNTFASPCLQRPLELGVDIVVHSATKFLSGHSDLMAGVAAVSPAAPAGTADRLKYLQNALGAVLGPTDCALLLRSLKTLPVRMERHCANALQIAETLRAQAPATGLERVAYPGLPDHPGHDLAGSQMSGFGAIITLVLAGGRDRADAFLRRTELFRFAVSLGGVESLIEHPASLTHATVPPDRRATAGLTDGLVRLSVGIEAVEDLIDDLTQALAAAK